MFLCIILTTLAVIIECFLNYCGILTWEWPFWQRSCPWLIWLIGYLLFFTAAFYVNDRPTVKDYAKVGRWWDFGPRLGLACYLHLHGLALGMTVNQPYAFSGMGLI